MCTKYEATSRDLIETSLKFAVGELVEGRLAASGVLSRLSELLLVEAVRRYAERLGDQQTGWLKGFRDPNVGRALALIHQDIAAPWTAATLAKEVALSRSAFMDRFTTLVGVPPIRYLTSWRIETAKIQLRETTKSVAQVAYTVGYEFGRGVQPRIQARSRTVACAMAGAACVELNHECRSMRH